MSDFDARELLVPLSGWRRVQDQLTNITITAGGLAVLCAILLICFYLLYEVFPLFKAASIDKLEEYSTTEIVPAGSRPLFLGMEEQAEIALVVNDDGSYTFFDTRNGSQKEQGRVADLAITHLAINSEQQPSFAVSLDNNEVLVAKPHYETSYPDGVRVITPSLEFPYGDSLGEFSETVSQLAFRESDELLTIIAATTDAQLVAKQFVKQENFITEEMEIEERDVNLPAITVKPDFILISPQQRWVYVLSKSGAYEIIHLEKNQVVDSGKVNATAISDVRFLLGGISLLIASDQGEIEQWFLTAANTAPKLQFVREFKSKKNIPLSIITEHRRKGFSTIAEDGSLDVFYSTSKRHLLHKDIEDQTVLKTAIAPRANYLLTLNNQNKANFWALHNEHPEVSWSVLWGKIWYENYEKPTYTWQSSAANNDFEPKYSFMPLAFGTLKAAFYAMLIATPLAICGAIYTAYFMAAPLRRKVKPLIELMEALPTVILGFLAGLWLAPIIEDNLAGFFSVFLILPVGVLLVAFLWSKVPPRITVKFPVGAPALILIPVIFLLITAAMSSGGTIEQWFFGGDMRLWVNQELGLSYDQRNALIVGIAMGFAVIPTIFSITEDAIFAVPKSISYGSLALGANQWQTLLRVVLPTASPGIFSALMIGMGRAVGETMIVLMATGNTAIMDANIFEGMRTLSANIAVEIGETEVDSSHYRVLFLAAFVLFMFTFFVNTVAEIVRHRLRKRYGSL